MIGLTTAERDVEVLKRSLQLLEYVPSAIEKTALTAILDNTELEHFVDRDVYQRVIRICLTRYGISPQALADCLDVGLSAVTRYADGRSAPHRNMRPHLIELLRAGLPKLLLQ